MTTTEVDIEDKKLTEVYLELRLKNFRNNLPFLILSENLPEGQVYREFADGRIEIHEVYSEGSAISSKFNSTLTSDNAEKVRLENGLL